MNEERATLIDSRRTPPAGKRMQSGPNPMEIIEVTVRLKREHTIDGDLHQVMYETAPASRVDLRAKKQCATEIAIQKVVTFAQQFDLCVVDWNIEQCCIWLSGTVRALETAFGTTLGLYEHADGTMYRGRTGTLTVPRHLEPYIVGVFGLDNRPQMTPHLKVLMDNEHHASPQLAKNNFHPERLVRDYNMPDGDGSGQTIALLEFGGGYRTEDLKRFFNGNCTPNVIGVSVSGGSNCPSTSDSFDAHVMANIEIISAIVPKARIVVYFAPNTAKGFMDAITTAVHDEKHKPTIISLGWGACEDRWTTQTQMAAEDVFKIAALFGITILTAAGDHGSLDGGTPGKAHVDFPASSPHVIGCGGTTLKMVDGAPLETVWHGGYCATGGGISETFPKPAFQTIQGIVLPASVNDGRTGGRGVPDVSAVADPTTGYNVFVNGHGLVVGGTSTVSSLYAGLVARINQKLNKPVGCFLPSVYANKTMREVTTGDNITAGGQLGYKATVGWNACTGLGTPDGAKLLATLTQRAEAGHKSGGKKQTATA